MRVSDRKRLTLIILAGMAFRFFLIWTGRAEGTLIADDAYYYFTIARNIVSGFGPTFDRLAPTNGFHPLWLTLIVPIFKAFGNSLWTPVRLALSLSAVFDLLSGLVIFKMLFNRKISQVASTVALIWFLSPFTLYLGIRGMEVSLDVLLILLLAWFLTRAGKGIGKLSVGSSITAGFILGMAGLARTDNLLLVGLTVVIFAFVAWARQGFRKITVWLFLTAGISILVMLPWFLWCYSKFGSIIQVSGQTKFYLVSKSGSLFGEWGSLAGAARILAYNVFAPIVFPSKFLAGEEFRSPGISLLLIACVLVITLTAFYYSLKAVRRKFISGPIRNVVIFSMLYLLVHWVVYGFVLQFYAVWYALPFYAFLSILIAVAIAQFQEKFARRKTMRLSVILILIAFGIWTHYLFLSGNSLEPHGPEIANGRTLTTIASRNPQEVVVGAFNAGALGYIAPEYGKLTITNLDCLVNNKAFDAVRQGKYLDYITGTVDIFYEDPALASMFLSKQDSSLLCSLYERDPMGSAFWRRK